MRTRALGFLFMVAAAGVYAVGCGSSSPKSGTGGAGVDAGTGGAGGKGTGGVGTGGVGTGGKVDSGTPDTPADAQTAPTFTQVFAIISDKSTATSPGCTTCHTGINPADGGAGTGLPFGMNFTNKAAAYAALVNVDSLRCPAVDAGGDASAGLKRVLPNNAAQSVLWQKLNQGVNGPSMPACDNVPMPLNIPRPTDGGAADGGDAGFTLTTYMVTAGQLATIQGWINAGALDN